jgi:hypothetical protein
MNHFSALLTDINNRLDLPQPVKSRIILEIAADLNDLYETYLEQHFSEQEARAKAEEKFMLNDQAIQELVRVHQSVFKRWMEKFTLQTRQRWEKASLAFVLLFIIVFTGQAISSMQFFKTASIYIYPLLALGGAITVLATKKFYSLFIRKDHDIRTLRNGLTILPFLGTASLFLGAWGYFIEIYSYQGGVVLPVSSLLFVLLPISPSMDQIYQIAECFTRSASVIMTASFIASITIIFWYALLYKITKIEQAEAEAILNQ